MKKITFPRIITLIDADIELFSVRVNSAEDITNQIRWAGESNTDRTDVWATDSEYNYFLNNGKLDVIED